VPPSIPATGASPAQWQKASPTPTSPSGKATLAEKNANGSQSNPLEFTYNPQKIAINYQKQISGGDNGASLDDKIKNLGVVNITINNVIFVGAETKQTCDQLLKWTGPQGKTTTIGKGANQNSASPYRLVFSWGEKMVYNVELFKVDITYLRFTSDGTPTRAEVGLSLRSEFKDALPSTNPTSGGLPGRKARLLDASECLPSLATANYGRPGAWRPIAAANGIDDPLRVRPGTAVYLPAPSELGQFAGGR
jgi:hypothetical protein